MFYRLQEVVIGIIVVRRIEIQKPRGFYAGDGVKGCKKVIKGFIVADIEFKFPKEHEKPSGIKESVQQLRVALVL